MMSKVKGRNKKKEEFNCRINRGALKKDRETLSNTERPAKPTALGDRRTDGRIAALFTDASTQGVGQGFIYSAQRKN